VNGLGRPIVATAGRRDGGRQRGERARAAAAHRKGGGGGGRQLPRRRPICPIWVGVLCSACLRGQGGVTRRATRFAARNINRGGGHGEGLSGFLCQTASGLSTPVGKVAVACACELDDLWVLLLPLPVPCEAMLSRPCPRPVGVAAFDAHGGWGNRVELIATEELRARLLTLRVDSRS